MNNTHLLVIILVLVIVAFVLGIVLGETPTPQKAQPGDYVTSSGDLIPPVNAGEIGSWVIIGTGLTAASFLHALPPFIRDITTLREASQVIGGRALSTQMAVTKASTITPAREFAAWVFEPYSHVGVRRLLTELNMAIISVELATPYTFIYDNGQRRPFGDLPVVTQPKATFSEVAATDPVLWFAHTGMWVQSCPDASAITIRRLDLPLYGNTISGFGWQSVVIRAIGLTSVRYNYSLEEISLRDDGKVYLKYASGDNEIASGVVLTMNPVEIQSIKGFPEDFTAIVNTSFISVSVGVLYAAWSSNDEWWSSLGFVSGAVATSLPIGRLFVVSANEIRMSMSGDEHVAFWTNKFINEGVDAAREEIAKQLTEVFGKQIPVPASAVFRSWPKAVMFWRVGTERASVFRPFGERAPVFWASSDISEYPGWVGGAVSIGTATAQNVEAFVLKK